jgi:hypothetical protein
MDRGKAINVNSTPSLYINGTAVPFSAMNVEGIKAIIDAELQKGAPQGAAPANNAGSANSSAPANSESKPAGNTNK